MLLLMASYNSWRLQGFHITRLILVLPMDNNQDAQDQKTLATQSLLK
jgi:hypothetical protein